MPGGVKASSSWVVREKGTGKVLYETFSRHLVDLLPCRYEAEPIGKYLAPLKRKLAAERRASRSSVHKSLSSPQHASF